MGLVDLPTASDSMPARPGGLGKQRREPLHPPVDRGVVDVDPTLGQQLFEVAVGQVDAQIPAHRQHDDVGREVEPGEG
jgi:hypothetical protein